MMSEYGVISTNLEPCTTYYVCMSCRCGTKVQGLSCRCSQADLVGLVAVAAAWGLAVRQVSKDVKSTIMGDDEPKAAKCAAEVDSSRAHLQCQCPELTVLQYMRAPFTRSA